MSRAQCSCRVCYPADEPQTWKVRQCRRLAIIGGTKCWQHARLAPCCPLHNLPIVIDQDRKEHVCLSVAIKAK